jgi:hypothetical protein
LVVRAGDMHCAHMSAQNLAQWDARAESAGEP